MNSELETLLGEVYRILAEKYEVDEEVVELIIYDFTHTVIKPTGWLFKISLN